MPALRFASCAASFCIASTMLAPTALAQSTVLKFSHFLGPQSFFQRDVAEPWAKRLHERSGGKLQVEVFDSGSPHGNVPSRRAR